MWGRGFVCLFVLSVNKVQNIVTSCWKVDMLVELWKNWLNISVVEIPREDDETVRMCCLLFIDGLVQFVQRRISIANVAGWGYISSDQQDRTCLPGQVERAALHDHELCQW